MTRHLDAVSVTEHRVVLALAREFADRAELAEAAIQRVRQVLDEEQRGYNPPLGLISRIKTALIGPIHPDDGDKR